VRLENNQFTTFPETLLELENMRALVLKDNKIDQLPASIDQLEYLEYLNVENNNLTELPNQLAQLPITDLNISGNNIANVSILKDMYSLDDLEMTNNKAITTLPILPPSLTQIHIDASLQVPEEM
jgi:Leucine-rich repeat (LRR) protein